MKGFMVVDRLNDIKFIDTDKEFAKHINEQAKEAGLPVDSDIYTLDPNIVMQQFSPLIMSQWFMIDHNQNPCSSITCENDFLFVFKHFDDYLIIAICGDGTESEDFLTRKCLVFIRLVGFMMGPVAEEISSPHFRTKKEQWSNLRLVLSTWTYLAKHEQSFLVEAIERLHVNQVVNEQCVELLQTACNKLQEAGEKNTHHALLIVNSKLLSLYSNRNAQELQAVDILCVTLLVRSLFPTHEKLEDLFAQTYRKTGVREEARSPATVKIDAPHRERYESAFEGFTTGDETEVDEYYSAWDEPKSGDLGDTGKGDNKSISSGSRDMPYPEMSESYYTPTVSPTALEKTPSWTSTTPSLTELEQSAFKAKPLSGSRPRPHTASEIEGQAGLRESSYYDESIGRGRSRSLNETKKKETFLCSQRSSSDTILPDPVVIKDQGSVEVTEVKEDTDYVKQAVFLTTQICKHSPYQMHCKQIYPGITLVLLAEMPRQTQAPRLTHLLQLLASLMSGQRDAVTRSQGQAICEVISSQLYKVLAALKKAKGRLAELCRDILNKWESDDLTRSLSTYLEQGQTTELPHTLERSLKFLHTKFMEIFVYMYLNPRPPTPQQVVVMTKVTEMFMKQLGDYRTYLTVKAQRNITMTTYIDDFPGLIHFIYVNRRTNQIMAPVLNITQLGDATSSDATQLLKDKIWSMTSWMQVKLHEGYSSVVVREGDYHYSYFLWFENCMGEPEVIKKPYKGDCTAPPPGILTGSFYKYIIHKCFPDIVPNSVHCNELFMMHVGLANTQYIASQCRQLASRLNDASGGSALL